MASNLVYMLVAALFIVNTQFCYGWQQQEPSTSSSVIVQGKVCCHTCSNPGPSDNTYFIPGASVAVDCSLDRKTVTAVRVEAETDEMGEFKIEIPSLFHSKLERCSAQLIRSPHASCNVPAIAASHNFILTADLDGARRYSAGSLSYRPHIVPSACYTKDSDSDSFFVHGREALQKDETAEDTGLLSTPPTIPSVPNLKFPPLPPLSLPPPQLSFPPLPPTGAPMPKPPPLPIRIPPLPLPPTGLPIPKPPPLPIRIPPLPLPPTGVPIPKPPPLPIRIPPLPLLTPPSPSPLPPPSPSK